MEQGSRTLESAVRAAVGDRVAVAAGPRPQDLTLTLGRAGDVVEVAEALDAVGLSLATLVGTGLRDRIRLGASGKGLHEKISSVEQRLPVHIIKTARCVPPFQCWTSHLPAAGCCHPGIMP